MAGSLNKVQLLGNLGADPEVRSFQSGDKVANLRLATSESWKDRNTGERKEKVEWHSVSVFGDGLVGIVELYLKKGSKVYVEGQLQTRKWQDQSGNDRYSTEIVLRPYNGQLILLGDPGGASGGQYAPQHDDGSRSGGQPSGNGWSQDSGAGGSGSTGGGSGGYDDLDDDIPF